MLPCIHPGVCIARPMPVDPSPQNVKHRHPYVARASATTRAVAEPTVRHATRNNPETANCDAWVTDQATWPPKSRHARAAAGPGHLVDRWAAFGTRDPGNVGLQVTESHTEVQCPPIPSALPLVAAGITAPEDPASAID